MNETVEQAVILLGGLGTRFLPATKIIPKEFFPINNNPAVMYHLQELYDSGIKRICIVISKKKKSIMKFFQQDEKLNQSLKNLGREHIMDEYNNLMNNLQIDFVFQGKHNGSGGAIYSAKKWTQGKPFALILGDDICKANPNQKPATKQLISAFEKTGKCVIGAKQFPIELVPRYSSIVINEKLFDNCFSVSNIIEKPKNPPTNLVGLARYILTNDIFDELLKCPLFENGEIRFTDALTILSKQGKVVCLEFDAKYYDCGNKLEYIKCILDSALEDDSISNQLKDYLSTISKS